MCGIAGILNFDDSNLINENTLRKITHSIAHRGPDEEGFFIEKNIGLGHRRLSIIDLSTGNQPMYTNDKNVIIVFNGEIYNYQELRKELKVFGYSFRTESDTEVILNSYLHWGLEFQTKLNGEWAFGIYDKAKKLLLLSRDRYGIKPLYYFINEESIVFSSEIKSFKYVCNMNINIAQLWDIMVFGPKPGGETFVKDIHELHPGDYLLVSDSICKKESYYDLKSTLMRNNQSYDLELIESLLVDSVEKRLMSDVSIGTINSGGLDSSLISTISNAKLKSTLHTFSVAPTKLNGKVLHGDESGFAEFLAEEIGSEHSTIRYSWKNLLSEVKDCLYYNDSPLFHSNSIPMSFMFNKIKNKYGVTVILGGEGADEVFRGYSVNKLTAYYYLAKKFYLDKSFINLMENRKRKIKMVSDYFPSVSFPGQLSIAQNMQLDPKSVNKFLSYQGSPSEDRLNIISQMVELGEENQMIFYDQSCYLTGLLQRVDRMAMRWGVEARVPFLDHRIVNYLNGIKPSSKYGIFEQDLKKILKKISRGYIAKKIIERKKYGFASPLFEFKSDLVEQIGALNPKYLKNLPSEASAQDIFIYYNYLLLLNQ